MARRPFNVTEIVKSIDESVEDITRRIAFRVLTTAVLATPVGDPRYWVSEPPPGYVGGHARRNWQVGLGVPPPTERAGVDAGGQSTISEGRAIIGGHTSLGEVWLVNNAPYIGRLNNGWSPQARPAGFVERAIDLGIREAQQRAVI